MSRVDPSVFQAFIQFGPAERGGRGLLFLATSLLRPVQGPALAPAAVAPPVAPPARRAPKGGAAGRGPAARAHPGAGARAAAPDPVPPCPKAPPLALGLQLVAQGSPDGAWTGAAALELRHALPWGRVGLLVEGSLPSRLKTGVADAQVSRLASAAYVGAPATGRMRVDALIGGRIRSFHRESAAPVRVASPTAGARLELALVEGAALGLSAITQISVDLRPTDIIDDSGTWRATPLAGGAGLLATWAPAPRDKL